MPSNTEFFNVIEAWVLCYCSIGYIYFGDKMKVIQTALLVLVQQILDEHGGVIIGGITILGVDHGHSVR